ncbi:MAG: nucleoside hydrolase [Bacteroidetes bacterium]|nr:nucleoside hydrolase [Bacteroidota bacterium]
MHVIIDTDAGVDDSLAIVYAANSSELQIEMLTTVSGNVPVREVTQNVLLLKDFLQLKAPVFSGAEVPRVRKLVTAPEVHGEDGVGGYRILHNISKNDWETGEAANKIVEAARRLRNKLTIISIGPMTNIAKAVSIDAEAMRAAGNIIQMGGVFFGYGNTTTFTEFNIFVDPDAADFVLNEGVRVKFVPLDVTEKLFMPRTIITSLFNSSKGMDSNLKKLLKQATDYYILYHRVTEKLDGCYLHDPITIAAAVNPKWFKFVDSFVSVETKGDHTAGMTLADFRKRKQKGNSEVAVSFDAEKFLLDFAKKVFGVKISSSVIRKNCLRDRNYPKFSNILE